MKGAIYKVLLFFFVFCFVTAFFYGSMDICFAADNVMEGGLLRNNGICRDPLPQTDMQHFSAAGARMTKGYCPGMEKDIFLAESEKETVSEKETELHPIAPESSRTAAYSKSLRITQSCL